jgi:phospholipid/cholesterol/gamma-HCH transport system substrate-binding protein
LNEGFRKDLGATMSNLNSTTASIDNIIGTNEKELKSTLESVSKFSEMLSANTGKLNSTFSNLEAISDTLAAADIYTTISNLKSSLESASKMIDNMNSGKGSAGQFLTNDSLYTNLSNSLSSLNLLLEDMKANPKKYVHFSLF